MQPGYDAPTHTRSDSSYFFIFTSSFKLAQNLSIYFQLHGTATKHFQRKTNDNKMASSYHLPYRGLPQELLDMIFTYALCPNEGLTICSAGENGQGPGWGHSQPCHIQGLAAGLLRTNSKTYHDTKAILYSNKRITLATPSMAAFEFIVDLPLHIKSAVLLADMLPKSHHEGFAKNTQDMLYFLIKRTRLDDITIVFSGDTDYHNSFLTGWFVVCCLVRALRHGDSISKIRFVYQGNFESVGVHDFVGMEEEVEYLMLDWEDGQALRALRRERFGCSNEDELGRREANKRHSRAAWNKAGFTLERDVNRVGEAGTVLVIRRVGASTK
ncbi:uncharacterized protein BDZ99DRAFT_100465 [Mytilinidion resinicola]|uniref:Uncharacterized protein n=1 Tax=Mytilinidion resinicola TaxID=574789 RepID=A0A6A6YBQ6_9PEZI|nr:uncharacterized protein BDZ99DRAFT_100465 [Mytilinidion resinicola]KAF2805943.1 hypothetical protein BDZ99DRAFT_100465 [Mytilinidion resinicola]